MNVQVSQRKLSTDFVRKLSAISVASDVSCISGRFVLFIVILIIVIVIIVIIIKQLHQSSVNFVRFGMEQDQLRSIMQVRMMTRTMRKMIMILMIMTKVSMRMILAMLRMKMMAALMVFLPQDIIELDLNDDWEVSAGTILTFEAI